MFKTKILKITFVMALIVSLLMPYTTTVLAATLSHEDTTAKLSVLIMHEGGEEASGTLNSAQSAKYDINPYGYRVGDTRVYKIITQGDVEYENTFYCLNALKSFPGVTASGYDYLDFTNVGDLKDSTDSDVKGLHLSTNYADSAKWTANYKALIWLVNNMYLEKQAPEQKDDYLAKAFKGYTKYDMESIKAYLTDDDIDVVQQEAIWYFTNRDSAKFNNTTLPAVNLTYIDLDNLPTGTSEGSYKDVTGSTARQELANALYQYLINAAQEGIEDATVTYPTLNVSTPNVDPAYNDGYYIMGPIKITSGTAAATQYKITVTDQNGDEVSRSNYQVVVDGSETTKNVDEIFDQDFYIYLPKSNKTVTSLSVNLEYQSYETKATLWENTTKDDDNELVYQPVTLLTREKTPHKVSKVFDINRDTADLALRKYVIKINDKAQDRAPVVDVSGLKDGTSTTATYKHAKTPLSVVGGDTVVYEIRVYNEADIDAEGTEIIDALPKGLELVEDSTINSTYGWVKVGSGEYKDIYKTDYLVGTKIDAFDKENGTTLDSAYVQIECKIAKDATASSVLTNVAEIYVDGIDDRDSAPSNNDYATTDIDSSNYTGNNKNKSDLTDKNYFYEGREDDDDFEKVIVEGKTFDLALKKFITKVNGKALTTSREPKVDVTKLKNGTATDATYTMSKAPVTAKKGDIITYTIRVYNEGEISGYAEEVSDYLPEGLGFLVGYTGNVDNYWSIPEDSKIVKLSTIENGKSQLSLDDFKDVKKLDDVDVVVGKVKLSSTKLKSSTTSTTNLIKGFDKENDTTLSYKDIQVTCIVLADKVEGNNFRNIAEIAKDLDEDRNEVDDIDSTPDNVNVDDYTSTEDDDDYENLTSSPEEFDLALQKFITSVNSTAITDRTPIVSVDSNGKISYTAKDANPLKVENNDLITYTLRVYNEGDMDGYAEEVTDDLPKGLVFVKDNSVNQKFGWKLYDKNGNETSDLASAVSVKTNYLSKAASEKRGENCLIKAFDPNTMKEPAYRDLQIVFKIDQSAIDTSRSIINTAEITDDADKDGNEVDDRDSTPGNNKTGEDDIDQEKVYVKFFDLALRKDLVKIIVTENGTTREIAVADNAGLQKVEINRKRLSSTTVKFVYNITVINEGEIAGYATQITDYIPEGLEFLADENKQWTKVSDQVITTNALQDKLLNPGETASVQVVLKWKNNENNLGLKVNTAEISQDKNNSNTPDIDSTPNNKVSTEDDIDTAEVYLAISTGTAPTYFVLATTVLVILSTGVTLIKKYVL